MNQHGVERGLAHMLATGEDHTGNPEEDNVIAGNQHIGGIELLQILGIFRPAQGLKRPQSGTEPGIQNIGITLNIGTAALLTSACILTGNRNVTAIGTSPCGNLMSRSVLPKL